MIDLYYTPSPNGHKITLFLEEAQLQYRLIHVDISKGSQFHPDFLQISPNNKIPAIIDHAPVDGGRPISLFESGEILLYLAEKSGKLLSGELRERHTTLQWLFWQVSVTLAGRRSLQHCRHCQLAVDPRPSASAHRPRQLSGGK